MECSYALCGGPAPQPRLCPVCKQKSYCSQQCRLQDWYAGHQLNCGLEHSSSSNKFLLSDFRDEEQKAKVLGKGSYGEVRLVVHTPTQEKYALKVLSKSQFQRESTLQVLKREISLHSKLDHPHIIKLYDHLEDAENVYLVLEYANRGSLFHEIHRQKRLSEDKARNYFKQTCEAVQYLHENDIIHRDIKPENILLDAIGAIKLCDFGWCAKGNEARTTFCGTLDYMAPEMVTGSGHSFAIDIWALGVLLFEMTHGQAPFPAKKEAEKCQQILKLVYSVEPSLSPELKELISLILCVAPESRLPIDKILAHAWVQGPQKGNSLLGTTVKNYVKDYGIAKGTVTDVEGDVCTVEYQVPSLTEKMLIAKVLKIQKRKNAEKAPEELNIPAKAEKSLDEKLLLETVEKWCEAPPKIPVKSDKFLQELEESKKKLEESLSELKQKNVEQVCQERANVAFEPQEKLDFPQFLPLSADESVESGVGSKTDEKRMTGVAETEPSPQADSTPSAQGAERLQIRVETEPAVEVQSPRLGATAVKAKVEEQNRFVIAGQSPEEERATAGFAPVDASPQSESAIKAKCDFEAERGLIEERYWDFYTQTQTKWAGDRTSGSSVIHAPAMSLHSAPVSEMSSPVPRESEHVVGRRRQEFKAASAHDASDLQKSSVALQRRKQQLEGLLRQVQHMPVIPRMRRPDPPKEKQSTFLRWLGDVMGCGNRY